MPAAGGEAAQRAARAQRFKEEAKSSSRHLSPSPNLSAGGRACISSCDMPVRSVVSPSRLELRVPDGSEAMPRE